MALACAGGPNERVAPDEPAVEAPSPKAPREGRPGGRKGRKQPVQQEGCAVSAYLMHEHGAVQLRKSPDSHAEVVGEIPAHHHSTRVDVVRVEGDWLQLSGAEVVVPMEGERGGPLEVSGWLDRRVVRLGAETCSSGDGELPVTLFAGPDTDGPVAHVLPGPTQVKVTGCSDRWWQVDDGKGHSGWLHADQWCDSAVTNCVKSCTHRR